jgi:hypothetical protein
MDAAQHGRLRDDHRQRRILPDQHSIQPER